MRPIDDSRAGIPIAVIQAQLGHGSPMLTLTKYGRFLPSAADREKWEAEATKYEARRRGDSQAGQWMAFTLGMTSSIGGIFLAYQGKETAGLVAVIGALGTLLSLFILGQIRQRKETAQKSQAARG